MTRFEPDECICRANCSFYKPNRKEEERCRGYTLASVLSEFKPLTGLEKSSEAFDSLFLKSFLRSTVCEFCPFYIEGCDFTSDIPPEDCKPCGGLIVLSQALQSGLIEKNDLILAGCREIGPHAYLTLNEGSALKRLETPHIYNILQDELYEVNDEGFDFLKRCDGSQTVEILAPDVEFLEFCVSEGLLDCSPAPRSRKMVSGSSPIPSLRYLEWLVTFRCNLKCAHCYLGEDQPQDFPEQLIRPLLEEFSLMQGLRVLISGGEPTLYRGFDSLNELAPDFPLRFVLLSNGMSIDDTLASRLKFQEVQISLDGMKKGHEIIRGPGTFDRALRAMQSVKNAGLDLSVATMIHSGNLGEWDEMSELLERLEVREWSIDYPCVKGRLETRPDLAVSIEEAAEKMKYGFGGSYHGSSAGWTCGRHLVGVLPSGTVCRCGLYPEKALGSIEDGLLNAWNRVEHIPIEATDCKACVESDECGGGCRFRAGGPQQRDLVMCALYGQKTTL